MSERAYLTAAEIAGTMGMPRSSVYDLIARGEFGGGVVNVGSDTRPRYRVPVAAFDDWRSRRTVPLLDPMPAPRSRGSVRRDVIPLSSKRRVA